MGSRKNRAIEAIEERRLIAIIVGVTATLILNCCIDEPLHNCPHYGLYEVCFRDSSFLSYHRDEELLLLYNPKNSDEAVRGFRGWFKGERALSTSDSPLLLPINSYNFYSLICCKEGVERATTMELNGGGGEWRVEFKNGERYLYCQTQKEVVRASLNVVELKHQLANSKLEIECLVDAIHYLNVEILAIEITAPLEERGAINLLTGEVIRELNVSNYMEPLLKDSAHKGSQNGCSDMWYLYCNPLVEGRELLVKAHYRISGDNSEEIEEGEVYSYISLPEGITPGKVTQVLLSITPYKIELINSSLKEWEEERWRERLKI